MPLTTAVYSFSPMSAIQLPSPIGSGQRRLVLRVELGLCGGRGRSGQTQAAGDERQRSRPHAATYR